MENKTLEKLTEKEWVGKWAGRVGGYIGAAAVCYLADIPPEYAALMALPIVKGAEITGGIGKYLAKYFA